MADMRFHKWHSMVVLSASILSALKSTVTMFICQWYYIVLGSIDSPCSGSVVELK